MSAWLFHFRSGGQIESATGIYLRIFQKSGWHHHKKPKNWHCLKNNKCCVFSGSMSAWLFCSRRGEQIEWAKETFLRISKNEVCTTQNKKIQN